MRRPAQLLCFSLLFTLGCPQSDQPPKNPTADPTSEVSSGSYLTSPSDEKPSAKMAIKDAAPSAAPKATGSPYASVFGRDEQDDLLGGLIGDRPGEAEGGFGLGLRGAGAGGGGTGEGTLGLGEDSPDKTAAPKEQTWERAKITPNMSRLMVGDHEELPLQGLQIHVKIDGFRARVLLDFYYLNDQSGTLEGNFSLRLPDEAAPYFLAFGETKYKSEQPQFDKPELARKMGFAPEVILKDRDSSWSEPKVARMVQKETAALAYREMVREGVDPAIAEWAGAGVFNARVFPLAPQKLHRIVLGYDLDLTKVGDDLSLALDMPLPEKTVVDIEIAEVSGSSVDVSPSVKAQVDGGRRFIHIEPQKEKRVAVSYKKPKTLALVGQEIETGSFFATRFSPEVPAVKAVDVSQGVFLVDVSLSANPDAYNVYLKLLESILSENRGSLKKFSVLFFNIETFWWKESLVDNTPENVKAMLSFAKTLSLEGATDLGGALQEATRAKWLGATTTDLFLLSDGAATWGESDAYALSSSLLAPSIGGLFAYRTGLVGSDLTMLNHLARESGGAVFSVVTESEIKTASTAHRSRPWEISKVEVKGGEDLMLAGRPTTLFPGQALTLVGRGSVSEVSLTIKQGSEEKTLKAPIALSLTSEMAPRLYGQVAVQQLEELSSLTEEPALAYARHFRITGKSASLLMLETEEDYERFHIKPKDDAAKVKSTRASSLVLEANKAFGETLSDPRKSFLAWLKKLETTSGVTIDGLEALSEILSGLPKEAFVVNAPRLQCAEHTWGKTPKVLIESLASRDLDYDEIYKESERRKSSCDALKALSSLVENSPGDAVLARDVAYQAMSLDQDAQAYHLLQRVLVARPFEPQTYHALGLALEEIGQTDLAVAYFELGFRGDWDERFGAFRTILGLDYLRLLQKIDKGTAKTSMKTFVKERLAKIKEELNLESSDLMITIGWNTDGTDIDLHVIEPSGEECSYEHTTTESGGAITQDVTEGYGPEMYVIQKAPAGSYEINVNYFASDRSRASTRTKVYATVYENWGTSKEKTTRKVVTLVDDKESQGIMKVKIAK